MSLPESLYVGFIVVFVAVEKSPIGDANPGSVLLSVRSLVRSRAALQVEVLALRHQLPVLERSRRPRMRLTAIPTEKSILDGVHGEFQNL